MSEETLSSDNTQSPWTYDVPALLAMPARQRAAAYVGMLNRMLTWLQDWRAFVETAGEARALQETLKFKAAIQQIGRSLIVECERVQVESSAPIQRMFDSIDNNPQDANWDEGRQRMAPQFKARMADVGHRQVPAARERAERLIAQIDANALSSPAGNLRLVLTPVEAEVLRIIRAVPENQGILGPEIVEKVIGNGMTLSLQQLTTRIIPAFRILGVQNQKKRGYFISR